MVRDLVYEALGVKGLSDSHRLTSVDPQRLQKWLKGDKTLGPKLHRTYLDFAGETVPDIMKNEWNQSLVYILHKAAQQILSNADVAPHFGGAGVKYDTKDLARTRIYRFALYSYNARAVGQETPEARLARITSAYERTITKNKKINVRHNVRLTPSIILLLVLNIFQKRRVRSMLATLMIDISKERGEADSQAYWEYALDLIETLGHHGMSDEEEGVEEITLPGGRTREISINRVLLMDWRHPAIRPFFEELDKTKGAETELFKAAKREPVRRVRVAEASIRDPPVGLPEGVFRDGYLENLVDYRKDQLRLSDRGFEVRELA